MADRDDEFFAYDLFYFLWEKFKVRIPSGRLSEQEDLDQPNENQGSEFNEDIGYMVIAVQMCIRKEWKERIISEKLSLIESDKFTTLVEKFISQYIYNNSILQTYFSCAVFAELSLYFHCIGKEKNLKLVPRLWCKYFRVFIRTKLSKQGGWEKLRLKASEVREVYENVNGKEKSICSKLQNKLNKLENPYDEIVSITLVEIFISSLQQWDKDALYIVDNYPSTTVDVVYKIIQTVSQSALSRETKRKHANEELLFLLVLEREFTDKVNDITLAINEVNEASKLPANAYIPKQSMMELWGKYLPLKLIEPEVLNFSRFERLSKVINLKTLLSPYHQNLKDIHLSALASTKNRRRACIEEMMSQLGCSMKEINVTYKRYLKAIEVSTSSSCSSSPKVQGVA